VITHYVFAQMMEELNAEFAALEQRAAIAGMDISDID
jgi:hypothetical protein